MLTFNRKCSAFSSRKLVSKLLARDIIFLIDMPIDYFKIEQKGHV